MNYAAHFIRHATEQPDRIALIDGERHITYGDLGDRARKLAGTLTEAALQPGDRVALVLPNSIEYVVAALGIWLGGFVIVPLNSGAHARDFDHLVRHSQARALIYDGAIREAREFAVDLEECQTLAIRGNGSSSLGGDSLAATEPLELVHRSADDLAMILYTSGTTGTPKGVMLSHGNLIANAESIISYLHLTAQDRTLCVLPFHYSYGNSLLLTHMANGASLVLENQFLYPQHAMGKIAEHGVTGFAGVPSTFALLLSRTELDKLDLNSLRYLTQAGGPMSIANQEQLQQAFPHAEIFIMYGQTEATARISYLPPNRFTEKRGSVGIPVPGVTLEIHNSQGEALEANVEGEVCVRGRSIMSGYWRDAEATAKALRNGWLCTGDMGYLDDDGYLFLTGRNSDFIKSGAHRISPVEVEEVISSVEGVQEVAVTTSPDEILGDVLRALIVPEASSPPSEMEVKRQCRENLASYKIPRIVEFVEQLPRTASGKLKRHLLRRI